MPEEAVNENTTTESANLMGGGSEVERQNTERNQATVDSEVNGTTNLGDNDYEFVPEKFKGEDGIPDWKKLSQSYVELEKQLRSTRPSAPKDIDGYEYDFGDTEINQEQVDAFKAEALEQGLSPEQYKFVMDKYFDVAESFQYTPEKAQKVLSEQWGDNFDSNLEAANRAFEMFGEGIDVNAIGNEPNVLELLSRIGKEIGEDSAAGANVTPDPGLSGIEVQDLMNRDDYWQNKEVQKKVAQYFARKHGE